MSGSGWTVGAGGKQDTKDEELVYLAVKKNMWITEVNGKDEV